MRVALGPGVVLAHVLQGLFHPARKVREVSLLASFHSFSLPCPDHPILYRSTGKFTTRFTWERKTLWLVVLSFCLLAVSDTDPSLFRSSRSPTTLLSNSLMNGTTTNEMSCSNGSNLCQL